MSEQVQASTTEPIAITAGLLHGWLLPHPDSGNQGTMGRGKESRGTTLVAGGSLEVPGAVILAGIAALRAGTGKLQIATCRDVAGAVAVAVPEARVFHLPQSGGGDIDPSAAELLTAAIKAVPAAVLGPGMLDAACVRELMRRLLPTIAGTALVLDAAALACASEDRTALHHLDGAVVLTPHTLELALMLGIEEEEVVADPLGVARRAATEVRAVVVLKGAATYIVTPTGAAYHYADGPIGLATSGSGDTLAGVVAGLLARGAAPDQAAVWAVYLHGNAGHIMTERMGPLGFLAREVLAEIPPLMASLDAASTQGEPTPDR